MQQLLVSGHDPFYWGTASKSEVDFLATVGSSIVPIEVKSGSNVRANSLMAYREKYVPEFVIRVSSKNFGLENGIKSVPLYAAFCI